jgi:hypothetical protein
LPFLAALFASNGLSLAFDICRLDDGAPHFQFRPKACGKLGGAGADDRYSKRIKLSPDCRLAEDSDRIHSDLIRDLGGVFAGANKAYHPDTSKLGNPDSANVGNSEAVAGRSAEVTASPRI